MAKEKRRGVSLSAKRAGLLLAVFALVDERVWPIQPSDPGRVNGIREVLYRIALAGNNDDANMFLLTEFSFDFQIVTAPHAANHSAKERPRTDNAVPVYA